MNEASDDVSMAPETMDMGGAPPHTDTLIQPAACGWVQNRTVQKTRRVLALLCSLSLSSCSRNSPSNSAQGQPGSRSAGLSP